MRLIKALFILLFPFLAFGQVKDIELLNIKAFPTAYGTAGTQTGGRGKTVYKVTNLNASGAGSYQQAIDDADANTGGHIVFDVSGTIASTGTMDIGYSGNGNQNISILGQTAPEPGIAIVKTGTSDAPALQAHTMDNLIMRHIIVRREHSGASQGNSDAFQIINSDNFVLDHLSLSWGGDEAITIDVNSDNHTVQYMIYAESDTGMQVGAGSGAFYPVSTDFLSFHRNLSVNNSHRTPYMVLTDQGDVINNIVHNTGIRNTGRRATTGSKNTMVDFTKFNYIGNYYQRGQATTGNFSYNWLDAQDAGDPFPDIWSYDNYINDVHTADNTEDLYLTWVYRWNWDFGTQFDLVDNAMFKASAQHTLLGTYKVPIMDRLDAKTHVQGEAGANRWYSNAGVRIKDWDDVDDEYIADVVNNTNISFSYSINPTAYSYYTAFHAGVSSTPVNSRPAGWDDDVTGIDDNFSTTHSITSAAQVITDWDFTTYTVTNTAGYTAIEMYAAWIANDFDNMIADEAAYQDGSFAITTPPAPGVGVTSKIRGKIVLGSNIGGAYLGTTKVN